MKELSIEEKAKAYDEAIERANSLLSSNELGNAWIYKLLPELKESEDDRIRKEIKVILANTDLSQFALDYTFADMIDWLEKQGEQKLVNEVKSKFRHGDRVRNKKSGLEQTLGSCIVDVYEGAFPFRIEDQDDWVLVEQKPAWSEEDEKILDRVITNYESGYLPSVEKRDEIIEKLKSLKERYTWKPSDEQMDALRYVTNFDYGGHKATLVSLYEQLKKLK